MSSVAIPAQKVPAHASAVSVAAPAFNEGESIGATLAQWRHFLSTAPTIDQFEIVICDDGSTDRTGEILDEMIIGCPELRVIHFERNQGAAAALTEAIKATKLEWVLLIDSDGQFAIGDLAALMEGVRETGALAAIGVRKKKDRAFARFGTWASGAVCNFAHGSRLRDFNSAFKLVAGQQLRALTLEAKGMNYSTEVTSKLLETGVHIVERTVSHQPRAAGQSHMRLLKGAIHRAAFVAYICLRQWLLRIDVLSVGSPPRRP